MQKTKLLLGAILLLTIAFLSFQVLDLEIATALARVPIVPLLTYLYVLKYRDTKSFFFWFLCLYAIGELLLGVGLLYYINESDFIDSLQFYGGNLCFILSYLSLLLEINKNVHLNKIVKRFPVHLVILLALDVYSVVLVSEISLKSGYLTKLDFVIEVVYNAVIMLLLTIALINYINRDSKKAMNLLIGTLCIVFSEVIQVAYFYVSDRIVLGVVYSVFLVIAFTLFYIQSGMNYMKAKKLEVRREKLENAKS